MKKILTVILAIGLITCFAACNNKPVQSGDKVNQSGEQNNNQDNNQNNDQTQTEGTVLTFEGNASTGYTWNASGYDEEIIKVEQLSGDNANEEDNQLVGAPSEVKFKVTGLKEGTTSLSFDYYRSWEGIDSATDSRFYLVTVDSSLEAIVESYLPSKEMETLVNELVTKSEVQFAMPGTSPIFIANAPTFVGLSEELFKENVVDSAVYEPMISPATSSMCIVKLSEDADVATLKQTVIDNCNPAKWVCTGAEKCLAIESGRYIMLVMSTPDNCEALKEAFTEHFGADNVGEPLTKDGVPNELPEDQGMAL